MFVLTESRTDSVKRHTVESGILNHEYAGLLLENLMDVPYHNRCLYERLESDPKYVFTLSEIKNMDRPLKYAFETTAEAIDFIADFLPVSMDAKAEISELIIGERSFEYSDKFTKLTVQFKINNPQP